MVTNTEKLLFKEKIRKNGNRIANSVEARAKRSKKQIKEYYNKKTWYTIRAILGNQWANWFILIGAKQRGKTFTTQDFVLHKFFDEKSELYHVPFYWLRLNDIALKSMLMNNGAKMFEPILVQKYGLKDIKVRGDTVFLKDGKTPLCYCYGLSTAYNTKGAAMYDAVKFKGANIILDECALEKGQRKTFDVCYNLKVTIDSIVRNERKNVRVFMMMNNTEECPDILTLFNFLPLNFGVYKLKSMHAVIDYIPNTEGYDKMRSQALSNELDKNSSTGNFTNKVKRDIALIYKGRLQKPTNIIKFTKYECDWYTVWDGKIIAPYKGEKQPSIGMKRYIDELFNTELRDNIYAMNDARVFNFVDILTQTRFNKDLELLKK